MNFITSHWGTIATVLLGISELLSFVPGVQANGVIQAILNALRSLLGKKA